ncbi:hypothetical protein C4J85_1181 [Pseudomonas sp. R4-34-07]|nr:hypothetical protein C4J85_1181 [Pseudomonas sp. R4-34-07]
MKAGEYNGKRLETAARLVEKARFCTQSQGQTAMQMWEGACP